MHADVGDVAARRDDLLAQFEGRRNAHGLDGGIDADAAGQLQNRSLALPSALLTTDDAPKRFATSRRFVVEIDHDDLAGE
jgi:hypothetical protein